MTEDLQPGTKLDFKDKGNNIVKNVTFEEIHVFKAATYLLCRDESGWPFYILPEDIVKIHKSKLDFANDNPNRTFKMREQLQ